MKTKILKTQRELSACYKLFEGMLAEMQKYYVEAAIQYEINNNKYSDFCQKYSKSNAFIIGAFEYNKLIAFLLISEAGGLVFLEWLYVLPDFRRRKVAKNLFIFLEQHVAKKNIGHKILCDCLVINRKSIAMLHSSKYKIYARVDKHWFGQEYYLWEKIPTLDTP